MFSVIKGGKAAGSVQRRVRWDGAMANAPRTGVVTRLGKAFGADPVIPWMSEEARALVDKLEAMLCAYTYDKSDTMTDYFNYRFHESVEFDGCLTHAEREAWNSERKNANALDSHGAAIAALLGEGGSP